MSELGSEEYVQELRPKRGVEPPELREPQAPRKKEAWEKEGSDDEAKEPGDQDALADIDTAPLWNRKTPPSAVEPERSDLPPEAVDPNHWGKIAAKFWQEPPFDPATQVAVAKYTDSFTDKNFPRAKVGFVRYIDKPSGKK